MFGSIIYKKNVVCYLFNYLFIISTIKGYKTKLFKEVTILFLSSYYPVTTCII